MQKMWKLKKTLQLSKAQRGNYQGNWDELSGNITHQPSREAMTEGKCRTVNVLEKKRFQINTLSFCLKKLEKKRNKLNPKQTEGRE